MVSLAVALVQLRMGQYQLERAQNMAHAATLTNMPDHGQRRPLMKLRPDLELVQLVDRRSTGVTGPVACSGCVYYYPQSDCIGNCLTMSKKCLDGKHLIWKERIHAEA